MATGPQTKEVSVGMRIRADEGVFGTVRFVGETHFAPGAWVGVAFDDPIESGNDGSEDGVSLFTCKPGCGGFFPLAKIRGAVTQASQVKPRTVESRSEEEEVKLEKAVRGVGKDDVPPEKGLEKLLEERPFLSPEGGSKHLGVSWVTLCRASLKEGKSDDAKLFLKRALDSVLADERQIAAAFRRFDADGSGQIERDELGRMCAYLGWSEDALTQMDVDKDGVISLKEFQNFVGQAGGIQQMFEQRRKRVQALTQGGGRAMAPVNVGDRVRSHFRVKEQRSQSWREAQVLEVRVKDCPEAPGDGVLLEFGNFTKVSSAPGSSGAADSAWRARQVVPHSWILGGPEQAEVVSAFREIGILDWQQGFFTSVFPKSELEAIAKLTGCQRAALAQVRTVATANHAAALAPLQERLKDMGYSDVDLQAALDWVEDLAPICVHVSIDRTGKFLETDGFYRNQFETKTSGGALDSGNEIRVRWERELFGGTYDNSKPFERPKYGALSVMNDYRGVTSAYQYGDSYFVMKDMRLRCSFAATDSGGIAGQRLGVLDKYAHVMNEFNVTELRSLMEVVKASSATKAVVRPQRLRGNSSDPRSEWVTLGYPKYKRRTGRYYFEVELAPETWAPQIGLASSEFAILPPFPSNKGVGDDENGWAADGLHCVKWNAGRSDPWGVFWPSDGWKLTERVTVGVAADLDERRIWFSYNGEYDPNPVFENLPEGTSFFPAVSLQGQGSFKFGPSSEVGGKSFERWPGIPQGTATMDTPQVGNSQVLCVYKEVQIHGEVSFKQNIQRLVANAKYRDVRKQDRSWSLNVSGSGIFKGNFDRVGIRNQRPFFRNSGGAIMYWSSEAKRWRMNDKDDLTSWCFESTDAADDPATTSWVVPLEMRGTVSEDAFRKMLQDATCLDPEKQNQLVAKLVQKDASGKSLVCKATSSSSFEAEWVNFSSGSSLSASELWIKAVEEEQKKALTELGMPKGTAVIATEHPYKAESQNWEREVKVDGAKRLSVMFSSKCRTCDSYASLKAFAQPLELGIGACVGINTFQGWVSATIDKAQTAEGVWAATLDSDLLENKPAYKAFLGDKAPLVLCKDSPAQVRVTYQAGTKLSTEIKEFILDKTYPITPIRLGELIGKGPAQEAGVKSGWFLDIWATCFCEAGPSYDQPQKLLYSKIEGLAESEGDYWLVWIESTNPDRACGRFFTGLEFANDEFAKLSAKSDVKSAAVLKDSFLGPAEVKYYGERGEKEKKMQAWARSQVLESLRPTKHSDTLIDSDAWMTFGIPSLKKNSGKYYYEAKLGAGMEAPQIGWCVESFAFLEDGTGSGVGDDEHGWGADGIRCCKWNDGCVPGYVEWGEEWKVDDILGCALDLAGGLMKFSLNGKWIDSATMSFEASGRSFYPALSGEMDFTLGFTKASWKFSPPDSTFQPWMAAEAGCGTFSRAQSKHAKGEGQDMDIEDVMSRIDWFHRRLQALLSSTDLTLVFTDSVAAKRLKVAAVTYKEDQQVGDDICSFFAEDGSVFIQNFMESGKGPAQALGVQANCSWRLGMQKTLKKNPGRAPTVYEEALVKDPNILLAMTGVTLCFESTSPNESNELFCGYDTSWKQFSADGAGLRFVWESDGDGGPEVRWGVFAVVVPEGEGVKKPSAEEIEMVAARWDDITLRANGAEAPTVARDGWDETRLRALCARHGWEFEWMTEDGEFRRRAGETPCSAKSDASTSTSKMASTADPSIPDGYVPL